MPLNDDLRGRSREERREERDELQFLRQPPVRWLSPPLLFKAGLEVAVSSTFGKFADKRELQRDPQGTQAADPPVGGHGFFDHSGKPEVWLDYLSDTGDGWAATSTMAWLLAQPVLEVDGEQLPRGEALLLGGDQVYPTADPEAYEDRFTGPFAGALPWSQSWDQAPRMYVTPGNHDWYDGLTSFLRLFCQGGGIGGWRTYQRRSYYALKLPHKWWLWAIDIQLDTYIDEQQLEYFRQTDLQPGEKVILLTAKPSWVKAHDERVEPASWKYLAYFEEHAIRRKQARLALTLTGDLHHYSRYVPTGEGAAASPIRITAGGGGAYLSATHSLRGDVSLKSWRDADPVTYERKTVYPSEPVSKKLSWGILWLARKNPGFATLLSGIYGLVALAMLVAINGGPLGLREQGTGEGVRGFVETVGGGAPLLVAILLFGALLGYIDIAPSPRALKRRVHWPLHVLRVVVAFLQTAVHLALAGTVVWFALEEAPGKPIFVWVLGVAAAVVVGYVVGTTVFAAVLFGVHRLSGWRADRAANEVFAGQGIEDYKNFLRMRINADGLTLFPIGVDEVCKKWDHIETDHGPTFEPRGGVGPSIQLIEGPLKVDPPVTPPG